MNEAWAAAGAVITALVAWFTARRRYSGRVEGTEASQLWAEQKEYRERLERRIRECEEELEQERLMRRFEVLRLRSANHELRTDLLKMQFVNHPDIPEETRAALMSRQSAHLQELNEEIAAMTEILRQKGLVP